MTRDNDLRTLRYWRDVEALAAPSVEDEADGTEDTVRYVRRNGILPWEPGPWKRICAVHFVRFGIVPRRDYDAALRELLGAPETEDRDDGRRAKTGPLTFLGVLEIGPDLKSVEFRQIHTLQRSQFTSRNSPGPTSLDITMRWQSFSISKSTYWRSRDS